MNSSKVSTTIEPKTVDEVRRYFGAIAQGETPRSSWTLAWRCFYETCDGLIRRYAAGDGVKPCDLEDCVQDVWAYLSKRLATFEYDSSRARFETWLYTIVRSKVIDQSRSRSRRQRRQTQMREMFEGNHHSDDPAMQIELDDSKAATKRILHRIRGLVSRENFRLVRMRWLHGESVAETARRMGFTPQQVWYREHRVRKKLRRELSDEHVA